MAKIYRIYKHYWDGVLEALPMLYHRADIAASIAARLNDPDYDAGSDEYYEIKEEN